MNGNSFAEIIKDKSILYIPLISMRSYDGYGYDVTCDGNVNRFISNFIQASKKVDFKCTIVLPDAINKFFLNRFGVETGYKVSFLYINNYPENAGENRSYSGAIKIFDQIKNFFESNQLVIYESNSLGLLIETFKKAKLLDIETCYWCPVSCTKTFSPSFLEDYKVADQKLAYESNHMIVASPNQYEYFKDISSDLHLNSLLIDPSLDFFKYETDLDLIDLCDDIESNGFSIIYLPFRLTDSGYRIVEILESVKRLSVVHKICVAYTDPNDSHFIEKHYNKNTENLMWIRLSSSRNSYYTMLNEVRCIIPYLENMNEIMHASILEFKYYNSNVVYFKNDMFELVKKNEISRIFELDDKLEELINTPKSTLHVLEGFDRIGKDSILAFFKKSNEDENIEVYIQNPQGLPSYRNNPEEFKNWLKIYLKDQASDLCKLSLSGKEDVIMTRMFISDRVYGKLFNREPVAEMIRRTLSRYFEFRNVVLLWKDYDEYLKRCADCGSEIEYSKEEFDKIQLLYEDAALVEKYVHHNQSAIINGIEANHSLENVIKRITD